MRDIVHIQVGQCGNQISSKVLMHMLFLKHADRSCICVSKKNRQGYRLCSQSNILFVTVRRQTQTYSRCFQRLTLRVLAMIPARRACYSNKGKKLQSKFPLQCLVIMNFL